MQSKGFIRTGASARRVAAVTLGLTSLLCSGQAYADFYLHRWESRHIEKKSLLIEPEFSFFRTTQNYDSIGKPAEIASFDGYSRMQTDATATYGLTEDLSLYGRLSWGRAQLSHLSLGGESFGLLDQSIGFNFRVLEFDGGLSVDLQAQGDFPAYDNQTAGENGSVFLGDGSMDLTAGLFGSFPLKRKGRSSWTIKGGAGYTHRSAGFSSAIPWSAFVEYRPIAKGIRFDLGAHGVRSLLTDTRAEDGLSATQGSSGAGGSFVVNAVNPSHLTLHASAGYQFTDRIAVLGSLGRTVWGQASPIGMSASVGLEARLGARPGNLPPSQLSAKDYGRSNRGFVNYDFEARVLRSNDRLHLVKIDKGSKDGIEVGQVFDVFSIKRDGSIDEAVARGVIEAVKPGEAVLKIEEYFREVWIEEKFIVKRPLQ